MYLELYLFNFYENDINFEIVDVLICSNFTKYEFIRSCFVIMYVFLYIEPIQLKNIYEINNLKNY